MDIYGMHKSLLEKWRTQNMEDCLVCEIYELQAANARLIEKVLDLSNRLRHFEYMSCPIQNADMEEVVKDLKPFKNKP